MPDLPPTGPAPASGIRAVIIAPVALVANVFVTSRRRQRRPHLRFENRSEEDNWG